MYFVLIGTSLNTLTHKIHSQTFHVKRSCLHGYPKKYIYLGGSKQSLLAGKIFSYPSNNQWNWCISIQPIHHDPMNCADLASLRRIKVESFQVVCKLIVDLRFGNPRWEMWWSHRFKATSSKKGAHTKKKKSWCLKPSHTLDMFYQPGFSAGSPKVFK